MPLILTAADRNRFAAFRARAAEPTGAGVVILPDVRGLHPYYEELALRFAENGIDALALDWFGRTAGAEPRGDGFEYSAARRPDDVARDPAPTSRPPSTELRTPEDGRAAPGVAVHDRLLHGRPDVVPGAARWGSAWPGPSGCTGRSSGRGATTRPRRSTWPGRCKSPVLGLFGGADAGIPAEAIAAFDDA